MQRVGKDRDGEREEGGGEKYGCRMRKMRGREKRKREQTKDGIVGVAPFAVVSSENSFRICARLIARL